jgi:hypothetical protein
MQTEIRADAAWRKSSYSGGGSSGGDCVEVARTSDEGRAVRDSKNASGPVLAFGPTPWRAFLTGLKAEPHG